MASIAAALMEASLKVVDNRQAAAETLSAMRKKNQAISNARQKQPDRIVDKRQIDMFSEGSN